MESLFCCPNCGERLTREGGVYRCNGGHCFDVAKEGYVNLLPANRKHSDSPGDDKAMTAARTKFLDGGWYEPLRRELMKAVDDYCAEGSRILDAGCGEGYYTAALEELLRAKGGAVCGVDLSKPSVKKAAKRCKNSEIAVASVYHLPVRDGGVDGIVNCFSPLAEGEFRRVLGEKGMFFYVVPGAKHLWEMKQALYDAPYENEERQECYEGFAYREIRRVESRFCLGNEEIRALFQMTPYAWKSPKAGVERLFGLEKLELTAQFAIHIFQRNC